jgi:hypothetical protein
MQRVRLEPPMAVLTNPAPNSDAPGSDGAGHGKAGNDLEFRARHSLTIDPMAHTLLSVVDARRLGAVPLGKEGGRTVIAVADPAESRLDALRELAGPTTKFVLIAADALNALLKSRIFGDDATGAADELEPAVEPPSAVPPSSAVAPPAEPTPAAFESIGVVPVHEPPVEEPLPVAAAEPLAPAPVPWSAEAAPPVEFAAPAEPDPVEAVEAFRPTDTQGHTEPVWSPVPAPAAPAAQGREPVEGELAELSAAVAGAAKLLLALQERVSDFANRFDDASHALEAARQEAREHKERLAVISAKTDQDRARLRTFAVGLSQAFEGLEETKSQLLGLIDED